MAPGVVYHRIYLAEGPWWIHVVEIDLPRAWEAGIRLRTAMASAAKGEKTSAMAAGALVAINGDFFFTQETIRTAGLQIQDGHLLQPPQGRSAFAITRHGQPVIGVFSLEAGLIAANGQTLKITGFNHRPPEAGLSFYDPHSETEGDSVHVEFGFELQRLDHTGAINDTVPLLISRLYRQGQPWRLVPGQWLVAAGPRYPHVDWLAAGDTVRFFLRLLPEGEPLVGDADFEQGIGGGPRILRDGQISVEYAQERLSRSFAEDRHPRTAIGYSQDSRILFLVAVDGRQPGYSVGMSLAELAGFMGTRLGSFTRSRVNAHQALNLDGGGSTTLVVREQVVNRPSDQTGERPVANALLVVSTPSHRESP